MCIDRDDAINAPAATPTTEAASQPPRAVLAIRSIAAGRATSASGVGAFLSRAFIGSFSAKVCAVDLLSHGGDIGCRALAPAQRHNCARRQRAGSSSFIDVLTAERSLYSAEDMLLQSQVLIAANYIAVNKSLGGGWDRQIDVAMPEVPDTNTGPHMLETD
ncbi:hypothetical protein [Bradyrhizobium sp. SZCCHNS2005]|uniref:hypothetical protein n=1 Tax=Bradyrhizobium sp. SZCCHNS2005 TaxID=3057303 RepID=UPI0028E31B34|nr:hypothetical protein [Bradyrhizobium sp. SZCCHNS2005]